jgi:hypothetical protein
MGCLEVERHESSKSFIEPKIIPPSHGHKISKPHVSKLMQIDICKINFLGKCWLCTLVQKGFIVSNTTHIFHCSSIVLRDKDLVIFGKWISLAEHLGVILDANLSTVEHIFMVDFIHKSFPCIYSHWWQTLFVVFKIVEGSCKECVQIC